MGRKNKFKNQELNSKSVSSLVESKKEINQKKDQWSSIENGNTGKSAREIYYKPSVEAVPNKKNYDRMKKAKRKHYSDGLGSEHIDLHKSNPYGSKKRKHTELVKNKALAVTYPDEEPRNVFSSIAKRSKKAGGDVDFALELFGAPVEQDDSELVEDLDDEAVDFEELDEEVEDESDEDFDASGISDQSVTLAQSLLDKLSSHKHVSASALKNLRDIEKVHDVDAIEDDSDDEDEEDIEFEDEDEDEEVDIDEELEESENDEEEQEDEECCDEECCDEDEDSEVSEQDADSDEEANLGESRECGKIVQKKAHHKHIIDFDRFPFSNDDSAVTATRAFGWIINACDVQTFFNEFYQQNALVVKRGNPNYYGNLFSTERLVQLLEKNYVEYGTNVNIASYKNGVRTTLNGKGQVFAGDLAEHLKLGRSVQLVNPQTFDDHVWYICEVLQELFHCFVGANTYLTPAGTSGFAPHWDEIDAFLLQLEGRKYWRVWAPRSDDEELPRDSSPNLTESSLKSRKPTFEGWVEAGDLLYIPRGFIHQARTDDKVHSLHVTISTGRQWAFVDLLEKTLPEAMSMFASSRLKLRRTLPANLLDIGGVADCEYIQEEHYEEKLAVPLDRHMSMLRNFVADHCMHSAIDLMAREFFKTALPPLLTSEEKKLTIRGSGLNIIKGPVVDFTKNIQIRLIRRHSQRLLFESEESCFLVSRMQNSRVYEGRSEFTLDMPFKFVDSFNFLTNSYPEWIRLSELPKNLTKSDRQEFCHMLYQHGLLMAQPGRK